MKNCIYRILFLIGSLFANLGYSQSEALVSRLNNILDPREQFDAILQEMGSAEEESTFNYLNQRTEQVLISLQNDSLISLIDHAKGQY
ncbi:MAG: hypothetical protein ACPG21_05640 [Crocinitomicaceae bacterium]